ncbi:very short patch repair endonuclease [Nocardioides speluncae]|uniref:very short patch repair endonuclease n=1 Tax=Nocardioides speluncae TaxID=2670337 RepID=UPI000D69FE6A|nr:very short patch repair endonuclease [Nocardioides speluncae]
MRDQASQGVTPATRRTMQANRGRDTGPELAIRSILHSRGLRFRVNQPLPFDRRRRADLTFSRVDLYVFVDGCFWHRCPEHFVQPKTRTEFWLKKINGNYRRDLDTRQRLEEMGATVVRIWEHTDPRQAADEVERAYRQLVSAVSPAVSSSDHC